MLSGMLCVDLSTDSRQWLGDFLGDPTLPDGNARASMIELFEATRRQLEDLDFSFEPLLPGDDTPLTERAEALGEWCQGFLLGIGYAGKDSAWPGESAEILGDLLEIGRLDPEASGDADESAFTELAEYVRVGVQVVLAEFMSRKPERLH